MKKSILWLFCIIIYLGSCTSSGKLSDAKFPYKFEYKKRMGTILPVSVGSHVVFPSIYTVPKRYYYVRALVETMPVLLFFLFIFLNGVVNFKSQKY